MARSLIVALLAFSACAPVYVPNLRNSPMFTKSGEFQAAIQIGNGIEGQAAFAVTDHFALMSNYSYVSASDAENEEDYIHHSFFEGAIGYYSTRDDSFFEVFGGYGRGKGTTYESYEFFGAQSLAATGRYHRYFIQPAFGHHKEQFEVSFAPRISMVDFYEFSTEIARTSIEAQPKFFLEPAVIGRINFANNRLFGTFQVGASLGMSDDIYFDRRTFTTSVGLGFRIGGARQLVNRL